jgi:hypothetical protein
LVLGYDLNVWGVRDAIDEIFGDVVVQVLAAHDDAHLASVTGKIERRRVTGANDHDMFVAAKLGFAGASPVIDARSKQLVLVRQPKTAILYAGGAYLDAEDNPGSIVKVYDASAGRELAANAGAVNQELGSKFRGLFTRTLGEIRTTDPFWKPEIVIDLRTRAGLAADGEAFDEHGLKTFRGAINRGAQSSRSRALDR